MWSVMKLFSLQSLLCFLFLGILHCQAFVRYTFMVEETPCTRLCSTKNILTVNGQFPGPTVYAHKGETIIVDVYNKGNYNITLHWHGVKQPRNPWADGLEYVTQCPIQPGGKFSQTVIFSSEEGTLWWHAHSDWWRATVHGTVIIYPKFGTGYPFPKPNAEVPIILGEWWKRDVNDVLKEMLRRGGDANLSDAFLINGQPGDLYPCSKPGTFKLKVNYGKTYLLRIINAAMQVNLFFSIANHQLTVVGTDGSYTKPLKTNYITMGPGQTLDVLLKADQRQLGHYYMAARASSSGVRVAFDNTTTTGIVEYNGNYTSSSPSSLPPLPYYNDTAASVRFTSRLRSLADKYHPIDVPKIITTPLMFTISLNTLPCQGKCQGPNGSRISASMNNISFVNPKVDILEAYYYHIKGIFGDRFPSFPPLKFNFTTEYIPSYLLTPKKATEVKILEFNSTVELVLQGTNLVAGEDHPMHLHGYNFYVVGSGFGNFDRKNDPLRYNLVDPPLHNTINIPKNGWTAIRFKADNPGVWYMHCHLDRHMTIGMDMVFIVKDGNAPETHILPPPPDMPPC